MRRHAPERPGWNAYTEFRYPAEILRGLAVLTTETGDTTTVAVKIRLKRMGKIRAPFYRVVVMDSRAKRDGRAIEEIGKYHPTEEPSVIDINSDRAQYWLGQGAQPTEAVAALLKITGDWQKYKGEPGTEGTLRVKAEKPSKKELYDAAIAAAGKSDTGSRRVHHPEEARRQEGRRGSRRDRQGRREARQGRKAERQGRRGRREGRQGRRGPRGRRHRLRWRVRPGCRRRRGQARDAKAETEEAPAAPEADAADKA